MWILVTSRGLEIRTTGVVPVIARHWGRYLRSSLLVERRRDEAFGVERNLRAAFCGAGSMVTTG